MTKEEICNRLRAIRREVDYERYTQGTHDNDYKIEIGVKIYEELKSWCNYNFTDEEGVAPQITGLDVEINYKDQEAIRLWKEVKA